MQSNDQILQNIVAYVFTPLYQAVVGVAFLYFLYGVVRFLLDMKDPEQKNIGKSHLLWGTIGLFIILSAGAILRLFNDIFGGMFTY